ncbi:hypothetical protein FGIG_08683 [Fasciola gigantica]|uniref:Uncharacterized protein n=1 Tax=Fasciola gigantica TaxID=46835 RepID=A0A504YMX3_FASGI|nr:hypothetical protein FGIG_08683 [Fasciola gigantica]
MLWRERETIRDCRCGYAQVAYGRKESHAQIRCGSKNGTICNYRGGYTERASLRGRSGSQFPPHPKRHCKVSVRKSLKNQYCRIIANLV